MVLVQNFIIEEVVQRVRIKRKSTLWRAHQQKLHFVMRGVICSGLLNKLHLYSYLS